ncbi:peptide chain release factor N(5)-glutamine methyltransferase [Aestuariibius insulae]|uniref:peptide chain release factor N(5)-glutamine methyltransferase n=1 Tax=Aestuariibius insulae TaxID=2058287 RepID=UPI00345E4726
MDQQALTEAASRLSKAGIEGAVREARMLWRAAMPRRYTDHDDISNGTMLSRFESLVARRIAREPMSHLVGYRDFYKHRFRVTADVLDPRPETETLVLAALGRPFDRVLDLGTGSGAIILSVLADRPEATGLGTDLSEAALTVARDNRDRLDLTRQAEFAVSDWYDAVMGRFDLIVSNPPYIAVNEMEDLAPELSFEPRMALTDEADGLSAYRKIIRGAPAHLEPGGALMVEVGATQAEDVTALFKEAGFTEITRHPDLDGRNRVISGRFIA